MKSLVLKILVLNLVFISCSLSSFSINPPHKLIVMKRTPCYGTCPTYSIEIYTNGKVIYSGTRFVSKIGAYQGVISKKDVDFLIHSIDSINFFSMDSIYNLPVTDLPSVILEVNLNDKIHKVVDRANGPKELKYIHKLIDSILNKNIKWTKLEG